MPLLPLLLGSTLQSWGAPPGNLHTTRVARLDLAQEARRSICTWKAPAMNLLGYEHMPSSDADRQPWKDAGCARSGSASDSMQAQCRPIGAAISTRWRASRHRCHAT